MEATFQAYASSLIGVLALVLIVLVQSVIAGMSKGAAGLLPGSEPPGDYDNRLYRIDRVYMNSMENLATMAVTVLVCLLVGARPWLVALLVWVHVVARLVYWYVYVMNVGIPQGGTRSMVFGVGWFTNLLLVLVAVAAAF